MQLMERRERWWTTGLQNAEAAVGLDIGRGLASDVSAVAGMEAQMASLLGVLRIMQSRAEDTSLAVLEQRKVGERPRRVREPPHFAGKDDHHQF